MVCGADLIFANIFLSLVNRSPFYSVFSSFRYKNHLFTFIILITLLLLFAIIYIPSFASFFQVSNISFQNLAISVSIAVISVLWYEVYKWIKRKKNNKK
ncbi:MAG: cation transporting ATPase C-terminal domain-containing protein [Ferruginibacter sp.]|nr:cation transporting ATPase C-terminal domain-containing protein [Bacteroidota bacterium]MBX2918862.1 cation transporting ATPase C-terminal domain-containing protein [Ferruginibacter sp.]MCC7378824.1 cation transporting ATPase C-terminal domain-containing protein [Chitinophagaceae bacterium]